MEEQEIQSQVPSDDNIGKLYRDAKKKGLKWDENQFRSYLSESEENRGKMFRDLKSRGMKWDENQFLEYIGYPSLNLSTTEGRQQRIAQIDSDLPTYKRRSDTYKQLQQERKELQAIDDGSVLDAQAYTDLRQIAAQNEYEEDETQPIEYDDMGNQVFRPKYTTKETRDIKRAKREANERLQRHSEALNGIARINGIKTSGFDNEGQLTESGIAIFDRTPTGQEDIANIDKAKQAATEGFKDDIARGKYGDDFKTYIGLNERYEALKQENERLAPNDPRRKRLDEEIKAFNKDIKRLQDNGTEDKFNKAFAEYLKHDSYYNDYVTLYDQHFNEMMQPWLNQKAIPLRKKEAEGIRVGTAEQINAKLREEKKKISDEAYSPTYEGLTFGKIDLSKPTERGVLTVAQDIQHDMERMINAASKGNLGQMAQGFGDKLTDIKTWTAGLGDLANNLVLKSVTDKVGEDGSGYDKLTDNEKLLYDSWVQYYLVSQLYSSDLSMAYSAGQTTAEMIPFILEMAVSGGIAGSMGKALGKWAEKKGIKMATRKATESLGKMGTRELGSRTFGELMKDAGWGMARSLGQGVVYAGTTGAGHVVSNTIDNMIGAPDFELKDGEIENKGVKGGDKAGRAFYKAFTNQVIEGTTEQFSEEFFTPIFRRMSGTILKGMQLEGRGFFGKAMKALGNSRFSDTPFSFVGGYIPETLEEYSGGAMRVLLGTSSWDDEFNRQNLAETAFGLLPAQVGFSMIGLGRVRGHNKRAAKARTLLNDYAPDLVQLYDRVLNQSNYAGADYLDRRLLELQKQMEQPRTQEEQKRAAAELNYILVAQEQLYMDEAAATMTDDRLRTSFEGMTRNLNKDNGDLIIADWTHDGKTEQVFLISTKDGKAVVNDGKKNHTVDMSEVKEQERYTLDELQANALQRVDETFADLTVAADAPTPIAGEVYVDIDGEPIVGDIRVDEVMDDGSVVFTDKQGRQGKVSRRQWRDMVQASRDALEEWQGQVEAWNTEAEEQANTTANSNNVESHALLGYTQRLTERNLISLLGQERFEELQSMDDKQLARVLANASPSERESIMLWKQAGNSDFYKDDIANRRQQVMADWKQSIGRLPYDNAGVTTAVHNGNIVIVEDNDGQQAAIVDMAGNKSMVQSSELSNMQDNTLDSVAAQATMQQQQALTALEQAYNGTTFQEGQRYVIGKDDNGKPIQAVVTGVGNGMVQYATDFRTREDGTIYGIRDTQEATAEAFRDMAEQQQQLDNEQEQGQREAAQQRADMGELRNGQRVTIMDGGHPVQGTVNMPYTGSQSVFTDSGKLVKFDTIDDLKKSMQDAANALQAEQQAIQAAVQQQKQAEIDAENAIENEYQKRFEAAKTPKERAQVIQEYLDQIKTEDFTMITNDNLVGALVESMVKRGIKQEDAVRLATKIQNDIQRANQTQQRVRGFNHPYTGICIHPEDIVSIEDARTAYIHERQHTITRNNVSLQDAVLQAASKDELDTYIAVISGTPFYKGSDAATVASEFLSMAMELAYKTSNVEAALRQLGIENNALIQIITQLDNEQRTDEHLSKSRRAAHVDGSQQRNDRNDDKDAGGEPRRVDGQRPRPVQRGSEQTGSRQEVKTPEQLLEAFIAKHGDNTENKLNKTIESISGDIRNLEKKLATAEQELKDLPEAYNDKAKKAIDKKEKFIEKVRNDLESARKALAPYTAMKEVWDGRVMANQTRLNEADQALQELDGNLNPTVEAEEVHKFDKEPANADEAAADFLVGFVKKEHRINEESLMKETNWSEDEVKNFRPATTPDGGMTLQEAAENLYNEYESDGSEHGWFKDPSEARDKLISVMQEAGKYGELTNYINQRRGNDEATQQMQAALDANAQQLGYADARDMHDKRMAEAQAKLEELKDEQGNLSEEALQQFKDFTQGLMIGQNEAPTETPMESIEDNGEFIQPTDEPAPFSVVAPVEAEEAAVRYSIVTDPKEIERLDNEPHEIGYRTVELSADNSFRSPMADRLGKGKGRIRNSSFAIDRWERSDENPQLADDNGKIDLENIGNVDYNPYIHIRPDAVNTQFKAAWRRPELVYVRTEYPASELTSGYKAEKAKLPVGRHDWSGGGELILSRWDKPVEVVPWEEVADHWMKEFGDKPIHFDIISPQLLPILTARGANIVAPHKNMGKACNDAYNEWKSNKPLPIDQQTPKNTTIDQVLYSIKVNHNSPYLLKKADGSFIDPETGERLGFDHRFMNTGEGAQAHGWGSYFSADDIRRYGLPERVTIDGMWASHVLDYISLQAIERAKGNINGAIEVVKNYVKTGQLDSKVADNAIEELSKLKQDDIVYNYGHHYNVEIPDNNGTNYFEESEPLKPEQIAMLQKQSDKENAKVEIGGFLFYANPNKNPNAEKYTFRNFLSDITSPQGGITQKQASEFFSRAGFVGTHYDGKRDGECYVIFDENDAKIVDHVMFSVVTPQQDADYMDAVSRGDMETAQRMVNEAAKAAMPNTKVVDENGNPLVVYRGTRAESPVRETGRFRSDLIFTSSKRVGAKHYGEPLALFINSTNPAILDYKGQEYDARVEDEFYEEGLGFTSLNRKARNAFSKGYDGLIVKNVKDGTDYTIDEYIVKNGSQIKSADTVTYDDQGNIIPLSERFNERNDDIRYSIVNEQGELNYEELDNIIRSQRNELAGLSRIPEEEIGREDATPSIAAQAIARGVRDSRLADLWGTDKARVREAVSVEDRSGSEASRQRGDVQGVRQGDRGDNNQGQPDQRGNGTPLGRLKEVIQAVQSGQGSVSRIPSGLRQENESVPAIAAQAIAKGYFASKLARIGETYNGASQRDERGTGRGAAQRVPELEPQDLRGIRGLDSTDRDNVRDLIKQWAKDNGYWYDEERLQSLGDELKGGTESRVFRSEDGTTISKSTNAFNYQGNVQLVIESMEMFGKVFPNTPYTIIGFSEDKDGHLCVVATQPYVQGMSLDEYADKQGWYDDDGYIDYDRKMEHVNERMKEQYGLDLVGAYAAYENDTYHVFDVHRGNYIVDDNGDVYVIDADITLNDESDYLDNGVRFSVVTPQQDADYMDAVNRGDMETAQRMVMEAAKAAMPNTKVVDENGNPKVVYHGTNKGVFTVFKEGNFDGIYFTDNIDVAAGYTKGSLSASGTIKTRPNLRKVELDELVNTYIDNLIKSPLVTNATYQIENGKHIITIEDIEEDTPQVFRFDTEKEVREFIEGNMFVYPVFLDIQNPFIDNANGESYGVYNLNGVVHDVKRKGVNDGVVINNIQDHPTITANDYIVFSPSQIKSADPVTYDDQGNVIPLSERFNEGNDDIRYSFVGRSGAQRLDMADRAMTRLNNLHVAREMEEQGKDAKAVKMATGWERGKDGKWRYEIMEPDKDAMIANMRKPVVERSREIRRLRETAYEEKQKAHLLDIEIPQRLDSRYTEEEKAKYRELRKERNRLEQSMRANEADAKKAEDDMRYNGFEMKLGDIIPEDSELVKAYPQLKDITVHYYKRETLTDGSFAKYDNDNKRILLAGERPTDKIYSTLQHEIQHAIQYIEGFASGGNPAYANQAVNDMVNNAKIWGYKLELDGVAKDHPEHADSEQELLYDILFDYLGYENDGQAEYNARKDGWIPEENLRKQAFKIFQGRINGEAYEKAHEKYIGRMQERGSTQFWNGTPFELYKRLAGETEARNVQTRLGFTDEQRRQLLAAETEDVAREDQLVMFAGDPVLYSVSQAANTPQERLRLYDAMVGTKEVSSFVGRVTEGFYRSVVDGAIPLKRLQDVIAGRGKVTDAENAYLMEIARAARAKRLTDEAETKYYEPMMKAIAALTGRTSKKGYYKAMRDVELYVLAKSGLERNQWFWDEAKKSDPNAQLEDKSGLTALAAEFGEKDFTAFAQRLVADYEARHGQQKIDELWKCINAVSKNILDTELDGHLISQELHDDMLNRWKFYVPMRGFDEQVTSAFYAYQPSSATIRFENPFKKIKGRVSLADNPFVNLIRMTESAINLKGKNEVGLALLNLAASHDDNGLLRVGKAWEVKEVDPATGEVTWKAAYPKLSNVSQADIPAAIDAFQKSMMRQAKTGDARPSSRTAGGVRIHPSDIDQHVLKVKVGGQTVDLYLLGNPKAFQALNPTGKSKMGDKLSGLTRSLSGLMTTYNPVFMVRNSIRDFKTAAIITYTRDGAAGMFNMMGQWFGNMNALRKLIAGKSSGDATIDQYWQEFLEFGGETGFTRSLNMEKQREDFNKKMRNLTREKSGQVMHKMANGYFDWMSKYGNRYAEDITRFAVFCASRKQGRSAMQAAADAKNTTANFNKKGQSVFARIMSNNYAFFNAAIQGLNTSFHAFKDNPGRAATAAVSTMIYSMAIPFVNMCLLAMFGDDDDWRQYENMTQFVSNTHAVYYIPGAGFLTMPYPQDFVPFTSLGNIIWRNAAGFEKPLNGRSIFGNVMLQWFDTWADLLPVNAFEEGFGEIKDLNGVLRAIAPTWISPVADVVFNRNFMGSQIRRKHFTLNDQKDLAPYWAEYDRNKNWWAYEAARLIAGGDEYRAGAAWRNVDPRQLIHLVEGYGGGTVKLVSDIAVYFEEMAKGDKPTLNQAPFIKKFWIQPNPDKYEGNLNGKLYEMAKYQRELEQQIKDLQKEADKAHEDGNDKAAEKRENKIEEIRNSKEYKILTDYDVNGMMKDWRDERNDITNDENLSEEGKQDKIVTLTYRKAAFLDGIWEELFLGEEAPKQNWFSDFYRDASTEAYTHNRKEGE